MLVHGVHIFARGVQTFRRFLYLWSDESNRAHLEAVDKIDGA